MLWYNSGKNEKGNPMSSNILAKRPEAKPILNHAPSQNLESTPNSPPDDFALWERLLLAEDDLADAPPIPIELMRRETLYGD